MAFLWPLFSHLSGGGTIATSLLAVRLNVKNNAQALCLLKALGKVSTE